MTEDHVADLGEQLWLIFEASFPACRPGWHVPINISVPGDVYRHMRCRECGDEWVIRRMGE